MKLPLDTIEARIVGSLIEKQITTPDQYPLSLNALTNACNQKSNREPLLNLSEQQVQAGVDALVRKGQLLEKSGFGSRVPKYQQRFCNMEFSELKFTPQETAIVCELLVRGPQTPGELRSRASRMAAFADASEVESALEALAGRQPHPLVVRLAREPGRRDSRYAHLFCGPVTDPVFSTGTTAGEGTVPSRDQPGDMDKRVQRLEEQVQRLADAIAELQRAR